ncbi:carbohydrate kinase [Christensenellaceae bacterium OttesenSCG-928-K19]|nr:carbohydrate kinase [Christensenellaceae bacterium OttesenSCG-928-K19]
MKKYDIVAIGENLIDFAPAKEQELGKLAFSGSPGGAPANVLACASKLGLKTAFISKLGMDVFGALFKQTMVDAGIDISGLVETDKYPSTLAFVSLDESGDRSFSFYRNETAECMIMMDELPSGLLSEAKLFHFGSVSMTAEPARTTTLQAVKQAKESGAVIAYDPNLRELLWSSLEEAKAVMTEGLQYADLVKLSDNELVFLSGESDLEAGMRLLFERHSFRYLAVTMGARGSMCMDGGGVSYQPAFEVKAVDTTGAGDAFWGAFLYQYLHNELDRKGEKKDVPYMLRFSNAAGALTAMGYGAIPSMPVLDEVCGLAGKE